MNPRLYEQLEPIVRTRASLPTLAETKANSKAGFVMAAGDAPVPRDAGIVATGPAREGVICYLNSAGGTFQVSKNINRALYEALENSGRNVPSRDVLNQIARNNADGFAMISHDAPVPADSDIIAVTAPAGDVICYVTATGEKRQAAKGLNQALYDALLQRSRAVVSREALGGIAKNAGEGYAMADSDAVAPAFSDIAELQVSGPGLFRYKAKSGEFVQVAKDVNPRLFGQIAQYQHRRETIAECIDQGFAPALGDAAMPGFGEVRSIKAVGGGIIRYEQDGVHGTQKWFATRDDHPRLFADLQRLAKVKSSATTLDRIDRNIAAGYAVAGSATPAPTYADNRSDNSTMSRYNDYPWNISIWDAQPEEWEYFKNTKGEDGSSLNRLNQDLHRGPTKLPGMYTHATI